MKPKLIAYLGAVSSHSLLGSRFKITKVHSDVRQVEGLPPIISTLHPSAIILRARTDEDRHSQRQTLVDDLSRAKKLYLE